MESKPLVSIITTFYNSGDFVHSAMNCLLNQTYKNIEFICVNDGSIDDTLQHLKKYQEKDSRIIIIDKENQGYAHFAKAAGQKEAKGKYSFLFDHDDLISSDLIENGVNILEQNEELDAANPEITQFIDFDGSPLKQKLFSSAASGIEIYKSSIGKWETSIRALWRTHIFKSVMYDEELYYLLNYDELIIRKMVYNARTIGSCKGIYYYRFVYNSQGKSQTARLIDMVVVNDLVRKDLKEKQLYELTMKDHEKYSFRVLIESIKLYYKLKLTSLEKEKSIKYLNSAFKNLNKKEILEDKKYSIRIYYQLLLNNFFIFKYYYKIRTFF